MPLGLSLSLPASFSALRLALYTAEAVILYYGSVVCYRRYFHPLSKIPGPFLPAVSRLYLWYWNVIGDGSYYKKIEEMHAKYGE